MSHSRRKNYRENIANTAISGYRGNNYRNIYKVPITAQKHIALPQSKSSVPE